MYHEHPLRILRYSMKNIWLLVFPLLRGLSVLHFDAAGFYEWVKGAWFDILIVGVILIFGYVRWYFSKISIKNGTIMHSGGVIFRVRKTIPLTSISAATVEKPLYLIPFQAAFFKCDTRAGILRATDMSVMVTYKVCEELMKCIPDVDPQKKLSGIRKPNAVSVMLFSAFFSSGFSGAVYIAAFFFKGGQIAYDIITVSLSKITETTEKIAGSWLMKIPGAAVAAGIFFLVSWLLSFIVNLMRYFRFHVAADEKVINITCGVTNPREYRINSSHINYTDLRQNLIMKLMGAVTVNISCAGYGYGSQYLPVLLPIKLEKNLGKSLEMLGITGGIRTDYCPPKTGLWNYIWLPFTGMTFIFPTERVIVRIFPKISELAHFAAVMLTIPMFILIAVKVVALFTSGISIYDEKIVLRCSKMMSFHTVIADRNNIVKVELQQTPFQLYLNHKCTLILWFCGEGRSRYAVKAVRLKDGLRIKRTLEN